MIIWIQPKKIAILILAVTESFRERTWPHNNELRKEKCKPNAVIKCTFLQNSLLSVKLYINTHAHTAGIITVTHTH